MLLLAADREELGELGGEVVGVGPVLAAARAATLIERHKPDFVVLIGTAGTYRESPAIGQAVVARTFGLSPGVAAMGLGYVPMPPGRISSDAELLEHLAAPRVDVVTVGAITTDTTLAERLSDDWHAEHMEAYGVALACREAGVGVVAVLGIANRVGPAAHAEWLTHRAAAQAAAREAVRSLLDSPLGATPAG